MNIRGFACLDALERSAAPADPAAGDLCGACLDPRSGKLSVGEAQ